MMTKTAHGFSLFEVLAAMAIVALAMVIAAPPVTTMLDKISFRKEVNGVMAQIRGWKLLAVSKGRAVTIIFDQDALLVQLAKEEAERVAIKEGVTLTMEPERILFSPEGWATPATIEISSAERRRRLRIDPLTGQPRKL
jgi:prepilin-type N-terminal cleavage/methylation domain-containing protein